MLLQAVGAGVQTPASSPPRRRIPPQLLLLLLLLPSLLLLLIVAVLLLLMLPVMVLLLLLRMNPLTMPPLPLKDLAAVPQKTANQGRGSIRTVRVFRQKFTLEDAIGSHACSLEANMRVINGIPLGSSPLLPVGTVISVQTLKAPGSGKVDGVP
jgi:hypothetical protein